MAVNQTPENRSLLTLPGAKGKVELVNPLGIVARIEIDGERAAPHRGGWAIPLKAGGTARLAPKGWLPGFQALIWEGKTIYKLGSHVGRPERIALFTPFLLIVLWWFMTPVALALFFLGIPVVKNPHMPRPLRIALPIVNTIAAAVLLVAGVTLLVPLS